MAAPEILEVGCAGCGETMEVEQGLTEFACPGCSLPQALPPELMPPPRPRRALPLHGRVGVMRPGSAQMPCDGCGAVLSVPWGLRRLTCPLCHAELAADGDRLRLHHAAPDGAVQVISSGSVSSLTHAPRRWSEVQEEPVSQAIGVREMQVGRYNKPIHIENFHGSSPAHSVHRDESISMLRSNTVTAVYAGWTKDAPVSKSFHGDESHINLLNETVARQDFPKKARLYAGSGSIGVAKVQVEHPSKVIHAPGSQGGPSHYSVHTEEVHGQNESDAVRSHGYQKARRASISTTVEQEIVKLPSKTATAEQVQVESRGNTSEWNLKRKRSNRVTSGKRKRKIRGLRYSNKELHVTCSQDLDMQTEGIGNSNTLAEPVPSPNENQFDHADIDNLIANICPSSSPQKQVPLARANELDNNDATLPPVSRNHRISQVDCFPKCYTRCPAAATGDLANQSFSSDQEHAMPQESSNRARPHDKRGAQVPSLDVMHGQRIREPSSDLIRSEQGHHTSTTKRSMHLSNERDYTGNGSYTGAHQQGTLVTASCDPTTSSPMLTATPLLTTTLPSVLTRPSMDPPPEHCQPPPDTIRFQDAQTASVRYMKPKKRGARGPSKLMDSRREADRPVLTPNNVDSWDIDPLCLKVASTISSLLKLWHPGSAYMPASQQKNEVQQGQLILHFHQYPSDARAIIMDEFLKRYKWAPGREAECVKLFDRKTIRRFTGLLCDEKRKARVELAASRKVKEGLNAPSSDRPTNLDDDGVREESKRPGRDPAAAGHDDDDPLQWKPFPPDWMLPKWWEMLCEHWASEEILEVSAQKRKNRYTGGSAQHTAGARSITMHQKLMTIENGGKPLSIIEVINKTHRRNGGKGEFVSEKARQTAERFERRLKESGDTEVDPQLIWAQEVRRRDRRRSSRRHGIIDKAGTGALSKTQQQMFTQDQVQAMINDAMQQLNGTWEKRFQSLEQSMRGGMASLDVPQHDPRSSAAGPGTEDDQASHQSTSDSACEGTYRSARDGSGDHTAD